MTLCQALLVLSVLCLITGLASAWHERNQETVSSLETSYWGDRMEKLALACSVFGGVVGYLARLFSDIMVVIGFAYCGHWGLMALAAAILLGAQVYASYEYSFHMHDFDNKIQRFFISLFQGRVFLDAYESWAKNKVVHSFARQKFVDAIVDSGPFAIFAVYVIFYFEIRYDTWLTLSVFASILGLAYGMTTWMTYTFEAQLEEEGVSPSAYSIQWHHYGLWITYFCMDFSLRLITLGLFLSRDELKPWNQLVFLLLVIAYCLAVGIPIKDYEQEQGSTFDIWQISDDETVAVRRRVVEQSVTGALVFTFLVNALPADLRLKPRTHKESRLLFALDPEVRQRILRYIIPLRSLEYVLLGTASMLFNFDAWQCASLVAMFITMHVLMAQVMRIAGPPHDQLAPEDLPHEVSKKLASSSSLAVEDDPALAEGSPSPTSSPRTEKPKLIKRVTMK